MSIRTDQLEDLQHRLKEYDERLKQLGEERALLEKSLKAIMRRLGLKAVRGRGAKLIKAASNGDLKALRAEVSKGAHVDSRNKDGQTALLLAVCKARNLPVIRYLLEHGADPNLADKRGNSPLIVGVRDDAPESVRELINHNADPNAKNKDGDTPLTNAACWGSRAIVELLLAHGANPALTDGAGVNAADLARQQGHPETAAAIERAMK